MGGITRSLYKEIKSLVRFTLNNNLKVGNTIEINIKIIIKAYSR